MSEITLNVRLETVECGECGGVYALNAKYKATKREQGGYWNCPYCKTGWGYGQGAMDRIRKEKEQIEQRLRAEQRRAESWRNRADTEGRRAAAFKGQVTKVKKRVANGVCPCCNRSFEDLHRHMKSQHPDWTNDHRFEARHRGGPWYDIVETDSGDIIGDPVRGKDAARKAAQAMGGDVS